MRLHRTLAAIAAAAAGLVGAVPTIAEANPVSPIKNVGTGLCMSSYGTTTNGAAAHQYGCNGGYNQVWFERRIEGVATTGTPLVNEGDHMCLNNYLGGNYNYNYETMWDCSSDTGNPLNWKQQYYVTPDRFHSNYWWIETLNSNYRPSSYCLSSVGDKTWGSYIYVYACNSSLNQAWSGATLH